MAKRKKKPKIVDYMICEYPIVLFKELYKNTEHPRLMVFIRKGFTCVKCGRVADRARLSFDKDFGEGGIHVDIYSGEVMMTVDHVIPKSRGGSDKLNNKVPMCGPCNWAKGNNIEDLELVVEKSGMSSQPFISAM